MINLSAPWVEAVINDMIPFVPYLNKQEFEIVCKGIYSMSLCHDPTMTLAKAHDENWDVEDSSDIKVVHTPIKDKHWDKDTDLSDPKKDFDLETSKFIGKPEEKLRHQPYQKLSTGKYAVMPVHLVRDPDAELIDHAKAEGKYRAMKEAVSGSKEGGEYTGPRPEVKKRWKHRVDSPHVRNRKVFHLHHGDFSVEEHAESLTGAVQLGLEHLNQSSVRKQDPHKVPLGRVKAHNMLWAAEQHLTAAQAKAKQALGKEIDTIKQSTNKNELEAKTGEHLRNWREKGHGLVLKRMSDQFNMMQTILGKPTVADREWIGEREAHDAGGTARTATAEQAASEIKPYRSEREIVVGTTPEGKRQEPKATIPSQISNKLQQKRETSDKIKRQNSEIERLESREKHGVDYGVKKSQSANSGKTQLVTAPIGASEKVHHPSQFRKLPVHPLQEKVSSSSWGSIGMAAQIGGSKDTSKEATERAARKKAEAGIDHDIKPDKPGTGFYAKEKRSSILHYPNYNPYGQDKSEIEQQQKKEKHRKIKNIIKESRKVQDEKAPPDLPEGMHVINREDILEDVDEFAEGATDYDYTAPAPKFEEIEAKPPESPKEGGGKPEFGHFDEGGADPAHDVAKPLSGAAMESGHAFEEWKPSEIASASGERLPRASKEDVQEQISSRGWGSPKQMETQADVGLALKRKLTRKLGSELASKLEARKFSTTKPLRTPEGEEIPGRTYQEEKIRIVPKKEDTTQNIRVGSRAKTTTTTPKEKSGMKPWPGSKTPDWHLKDFESGIKPPDPVRESERQKLKEQRSVAQQKEIATRKEMASKRTGEIEFSARQEAAMEHEKKFGKPKLDPFGVPIQRSTVVQTVVEILIKAMTAGHGYAGDPGSLSGGSALMTESLNKKMCKVCKSDTYHVGCDCLKCMLEKEWAPEELESLRKKLAKLALKSFMSNQMYKGNMDVNTIMEIFNTKILPKIDEVFK